MSKMDDGRDARRETGPYSKPAPPSKSPPPTRRAPTPPANNPAAMAPPARAGLEPVAAGSVSATDPMATILGKLEDIQNDMKNVAKKDDIANLVTSERLDEKAEEVKDWARERFARKDNILPRLKALEKQREKDVEQTLQFMRAQSMNSIYIGNLGEDDKDKTIKEWIQKSCKNLGDKYNPSIFPTPDGKKHAVVTFDSNSQAKSFLDAIKKKDIKNADGKPIKVRYNKDKAQRAIEAPLLPIQQRLLKLYGGDKGKPTTPVSIQTNKIKVGGAVVIVLDGLGGWR